jgi:hypothetical protein
VDTLKVGVANCPPFILTAGGRQKLNCANTKAWNKQAAGNAPNNVFQDFQVISCNSGRERLNQRG